MFCHDLLLSIGAACSLHAVHSAWFDSMSVCLCLVINVFICFHTRSSSALDHPFQVFSEKKINLLDNYGNTCHSSILYVK